MADHSKVTSFPNTQPSKQAPARSYRKQISDFEPADRSVDATGCDAHHLESPLVADTHAACREDRDEQATQDGLSISLPAVVEAEACDTHPKQGVVIATQQSLLRLLAIRRRHAVADQIGDVVERATASGNLPIDRSKAIVPQGRAEQQVVRAVFV